MIAARARVFEQNIGSPCRPPVMRRFYRVLECAETELVGVAFAQPVDDRPHAPLGATVDVKFTPDDQFAHVVLTPKITVWALLGDDDKTTIEEVRRALMNDDGMTIDRRRDLGKLLDGVLRNMQRVEIS